MCACVSVQWYPSLCYSTYYSPPGSSVHGIFQAQILKWVAMSFSRGSSQPRYQTHIFYVSCIAGRFFTNHLGNPISQTEKSKYCKISLISGIKKERKGKRKKKYHKYREQTGVCQRCRVGSGWNRLMDSKITNFRYWGDQNGRVQRSWTHLPPWRHQNYNLYRATVPENDMKTSRMALLQPTR